jgi:DtxR family Mn-dependent transcriptional regulator
VPRRHDPRDLSAAAQEYLLALRVMAGAEDAGRVNASQIARRLGVTTQAASEMFRRLVAEGLVVHAEGRDLHLSPAGRAVADAIFRRHALLEWLLTAVVGLGWAESDEEAMRLQGAISPRVETRLDEMLGHPETCPHGNPIDAETARRRPAGVPLSQIEAGQPATVYRITEEAEEDAGLLSYLEARALTPGAPITVLARSESLDSLTLDGPRGRATLGLRPAALVRVLPGTADPGLFHKVPSGVAAGADT